MVNGGEGAGGVGSVRLVALGETNRVLVSRSHRKPTANLTEMLRKKRFSQSGTTRLGEKLSPRSRAGSPDC